MAKVDTPSMQRNGLSAALQYGLQRGHALQPSMSHAQSAHKLCARLLVLQGCMRKAAIRKSSRQRADGMHSTPASKSRQRLQSGWAGMYKRAHMAATCPWSYDSLSGAQIVHQGKVSACAAACRARMG